MLSTVRAAGAGVVGRSAESRLVREDGSRARLILREEIEIVGADEDSTRARGYGDDVPWRVPAITAAALTVAGELEVMLASLPPDERLVSALAVPALTVPVTWSRRAPLGALAVVAVALPVQAAAGGFLVGSAVTTVVVLALLLYCAARYSTGAWRFAGAACAAATVAGTRIAFDPAARTAREALLTFVAVAIPLVVGRWAAAQRHLQRELADLAARRARDRARDVRVAAEEERARIAADLQSAVAGGLRAIVDDAAALQGELRSGEAEPARERLARIAATARAALADVRRVLGVLRHEGEPRRLAPPRTPVLVPLDAAGLAASAGPVSGSADAPRALESAVPGNDPPASTAVSPPVLAGRLSGLVTEPRADRVVAAAVAVAIAVELALVTGAGAALTAVPIAAALLWRRRRPVVAAAGVLGAIALQSALVGPDSFPLGDMLAMVAAAYAIGAHAARPGAVLVLAAGAAAHAALVYPGGVVAALLGGVALPWTVGRVVRGNRALTREGRRRNAEIEHNRRREAQAAVTRERTRVARELHDAVAHNVSVIAIQAGGAAGLVGRDPERAGDCAALIATVANEALAELGRLTSLPAVADAGAPPSMARVDALAGRARAAGLAVTLEVDGRTLTLPAGIDLAAFRIVQEALANAGKHARAGRAWVTVRYAPRAIELEIADDGRGPKGGADQGGHGLIGMRERVALYGGSIEIGPRAPGGGFLVRARLPLDAA